jgi:hypothetical protein
MFDIEGKLLQKLNQSSESNNYAIKISDKQFNYTKAQIALLSPIAFKFFIHHTGPFIIEIPSSFNHNDLLSCFKQLDSLFHSIKEITISTNNVKIFSFLADFLDYRFLMKKCKKVNSNQPQKFILSSKQSFCLSKSLLNHLIDFDLIINDIKIEINFSLFSFVCDKFQELPHQENQLTISISNVNLNCFLSFFDLMKGYSFYFENSDFPNLKDLINCFGINSLLQVIGTKIPIPQTLEESLQFISQSYCDLLEEQFNSSLLIIIQNFNAISFEALKKFQIRV